jgi:pseudo-rSAM protein
MKYNRSFFYFEPNIHINIGLPNTVLIYNFSTAKETLVRSIPFFLKVKQLINEYEFGFYIDQPELIEVCQSLKDNLIGDIIVTKENKLPFLIPPHFFKVEKTRDYFTKLESRNINNNIFDYIFNLDLFIGTSFSDSNKNIFPHLSNNNVISNVCFDDLIDCLKDYKFCSNIQSVNIYIANSNIDSSVFFKKLRKILGTTTINLHLPVILSNNYIGDYKRNLYFDSRQIENPKVLNKLINKISIHDSITFVVESAKQFYIAEKIAIVKELDSYSVYPNFNGSNYEFFRKNVFIDHSTLFEEILSIDELFRNSQLNTNDFGRILIDSNGSYKTNLLGKTIGQINNDDLLKIVFNCITDTHSS